jgi:outer membrane receptor protein involved in Fe transport
MKNVNSNFRKLGILLAAALMICWQGAFAQNVTTVSGKVTDADSNFGLAGVNIRVKGTIQGSISDVNGNFRVSVNQQPPITLVFSMIGYQTQEIEVTSREVNNLNIKMKEAILLGQEVVVSASRVEESILESPVTVERMDILAIRETAAPSFYQALANLKGVEMSTQSLTFQSFNTRGFNANGNVRTVQMIDGMDNQAPGLNFSVGNIAGISELDLESVELLPGAASALYGPNAINGILLMTSKNPFQYQGLSVNLKSGLMNEQSRRASDGSQLGGTGFIDFSARYAKAINNKLAFKVNLAHLQADDWQANDFRDMSLANGFGLETGNRINNPGFNGVNTYGDENAVNMNSVAQSMVGAGALPGALLPLIPQTLVTRTGYMERDLADYATRSTKLNAALHYRMTDKVEAILQANYGTGTTVYTGADRYSITGFSLGQYKLEFKGENWFVRAYTTQERSGDAFAVGITAQGLNEAYNPSTIWFPEYVGAFAQARAQGANEAAAHAAARAFADRNRLQPGTPAFDQAKAAIVSRPIPGTAAGVGSQFLDKTNLYHAEFMYDFSKDIKFADFIIGGNFRQYALNSEGTLFALDNDGNEFTINEFGGYLQGTKRLFNDALKITSSVRYDKNENFLGQWSPRASAVYTFANTNNIRASWQTGFRIPTTQDQYIDLNTPQARLIGGLPLFRDRYNMINNPVYSLQTVTQFGGAVLAGTQNPAIQQAAIQQAQQLVMQQVAAGQIPNNPAAIQAAVSALVPQLVPVLAAQGAQNLLTPYEFQPWEPERVRVFEIGYKGLIGNKLLIDSYYYWNTFDVFSGGQIVVQDINFNPANPASALGLNLLSANTRQVYSFPVSDRSKIRSNGWALGLDYVLPKGYRVGGNVSYNALIQDEASETITNFNTPDYRFNLNFANREVVKNVGFNVVYRWQNEFVWNSSIVSPALNAANLAVVPAFGTLDAQVSYRLRDLKSIIKVGGSNILNNSYQQAFVNPFVGSMYFVSITFDEFLN